MGINALISDFGSKFNQIKDDDSKFQYFKDYIEKNPKLVWNNQVRIIFGLLVCKTKSIKKAFEALIDCQTDNTSHYLVIQDMVWKYLILNDGIGGRSINDIMMYMKEHREIDFYKVMESIQDRIAKLKVAPLFGGIFKQ